MKELLSNVSFNFGDQKNCFKANASMHKIRIILREDELFANY